MPDVFTVNQTPNPLQNPCRKAWRPQITKMEQPSPFNSLTTGDFKLPALYTIALHRFQSIKASLLTHIDNLL
ncbi:hypothetical protein M405DRAFT_822560 [Rhizopogon salebrosus TDB-379]|nr:hypothetical protein M405DRAFT_822560 [Rhizopogon salebrosus TDB-379]